MDEIQSAERRYLSLPVIFLCIDDGPVFCLLHFEVGEFVPVMGLDVLVGVAPSRPVKARTAWLLETPTVRAIAANGMRRSRN